MRAACPDMLPVASSLKHLVDAARWPIVEPPVFASRSGPKRPGRSLDFLGLGADPGLP
jgi:hypothetical protein